MIKILVLIFVIIIFFIIYYIFFRELYGSDNTVVGNKHLKVDKLMIVAHPDDELIFGGSLLLKDKGWKVVSFTNGTKNSHNKFSLKSNNRKEEFINSMNRFGCQYEIWDFEDNLFNANWNQNKVLDKLNNLFKKHSNYKMVVTHNKDGEYGHIQHKKVHELVSKLHPKNLYVFGYNKNSSNPFTERLVDISSVYGSQKDIIEKYMKYIIHQDYDKIY